MPRERDGNWIGVGVGTISQDGGRLMDTTNGILADKKQGQFVTKSQIPDPPVSPQSPLWPHSPCALLSALAKDLLPDSGILVFLLGAGAQIL